MRWEQLINWSRNTAVWTNICLSLNVNFRIRTFSPLKAPYFIWSYLSPWELAATATMILWVNVVNSLPYVWVCRVECLRGLQHLNAYFEYSDLRCAVLKTSLLEGTNFSLQENMLGAPVGNSKFEITIIKRSWTRADNFSNISQNFQTFACFAHWGQLTPNAQTREYWTQFWIVWVMSQRPLPLTGFFKQAFNDNFR